jgi:hypothetical protein
MMHRKGSSPVQCYSHLLPLQGKSTSVLTKLAFEDVTDLIFNCLPRPQTGQVGHPQALQQVWGPRSETETSRRRLSHLECHSDL